MKQVFGKGIESLIPKKSKKIDQSSLPQKQEAVFFIEIEKIKPNPYQPRKEFDSDGLQSLSVSIQEHGILQPLIASKIEKDVKGGRQIGYQLIAGERRLLAAKMCGLTQVPLIIREPTEQEKLEISLIENVQRRDLNLMEKAEAYKKLDQDFHFGHEAIAKMVGVSRPVITNTLRILNLPTEIKQAVREEKITEGHTRAILMAKEPIKQKNLFSKILRDGLNVREAEAMAQKLEVWQPKPKTIKFIEEFKELENKAKEILGIETLKFGMEINRPKLTIFFKTKKQIEDLLERFK